jgi:hypothetical protein
MKKVFVSVMGFVLAIVIGISSCKKETTSPLAPQSPAHQLRSLSANTPCGTSTVVELVAGQNMNAGTVTVSNDANNLTVTYSTANGWTMSEVHLYVGDCALIPTNGPGNPVPGHFPYSANLNNAQQYTVTIPLSQLGNCFCVAAHAIVSSAGGGTQTAWGAGTRFVDRGNWATYFQACKQTCSEGCVISPATLFRGEANWPIGSSVVVGGFTYGGNDANNIYNSNSSDGRLAFIDVATLKISINSVSPTASVWPNAAIVENWLASLGQPITSSTQFTAPANVEAAILAVEQWEKAHTCP